MLNSTLFVFFFSFYAYSLHLYEVPLELDRINSLLSDTKIKACHESSSSEDVEDMNLMSFEYAQLNHKNLFKCGQATDFANFRAYASWRYCRDKYGETAWTCSENNNDIIKKRLENKNLLESVKEFTKSRFKEYKDSLAYKCCGDKKKHCLKRFQAVELDIKEDNSSWAQYTSDIFARKPYWNHVQVSTAKLIENYTKEGIERLLLHELGHACHFALISEDKKLYREFTHPNTLCTQETAEKAFMMDRFKSLECVNERLKKQIDLEDDNTNHCYGRWYREAFADMVFRDEMTTIYHWTFDMYRVSTSTNYGNVFDYIQCDLENLDMKKVCD